MIKGIIVCEWAFICFFCFFYMKDTFNYFFINMVNIVLKVHYATFLWAVNKQTELLIQETVVCRS